MAATNPFYYLEAATLSSLLTKYVACLEAIATTGVSYTIGGTTFTRADANTVANIIGQIKAAQRFQSGSRVKTVYASFRDRI